MAKTFAKKTAPNKALLTSGQKRARGKGGAPARVALFSQAVERLGQVRRWEFFDNPFEGRRSEANAYLRGFRARITDWSMGRETPETIDFRRTTDAAAYEQGYADAKAQEA